MINIHDVTNKVEFGAADGECLNIIKCICGEKFDAWSFLIHDYDEKHGTPCPKCGRRFFFRTRVKIFEVINTEEDV